MNAIFFLNSFLLGVALAMDAFSISIANAMSDSSMPKGKMCIFAGTFSFFQFFMPMVGWTLVHFVVERFSVLQKYLPWASLLLLGFIGGKMIVESIREGKEERSKPVEAAGKDCVAETPADCATGGKSVSGKSLSENSFSAFIVLLLFQGVATSLDALSVGFAIADYTVFMASISSIIIAAVTFAISFSGLLIGKKAGKLLGKRAEIFGGCILIFIGIEIFVKSFFA